MDVVQRIQSFLLSSGPIDNISVALSKLMALAYGVCLFMSTGQIFLLDFIECFEDGVSAKHLNAKCLATSAMFTER